MDYLVWLIIIFLIGYFFGVKSAGNRYKTRKNRYTSQNNNTYDYEQKTPSVCIEKEKIFKDSRWDDKNELFWGMIENGVMITGKHYLTTKTEKKYFDNLVTWFDKYCSIHCQVSLGRLFILPEQEDFTPEERKRFFSIYNHMSLDFVMISKLNNTIICVIELDDKTHEEDLRKQRDEILNCLLEKAGIPYLHVPVEQIEEKPPIWDVRKKTKEKFQEQIEPK